MSTVVVTTSYPAYPGDPAGHFVASEVAELRDAGEDVHVIAPKEGGAFGWPGAAARIRERPWRIVDAGRFLARIRRELGTRKPQRVIAHWAVPCGLAATGPWELELVSHGGDVRLMLGMPTPLRHATVRHCLHHAKTWRFVSEALRDSLADSLPLPLGRLLLHKCIVQPSPIQVEPAREDSVPPRSANETRLVWVGRLVPSKNLEGALLHVRNTHKDAHLVVVGDGPERARMERRAGKLGVRASFVGRVPRPEALAWIASADTLLMSSHAEGLSTVVREAEALGTPVLWV